MTTTCPLCGRFIRVRNDGLVVWHLSLIGPKIGAICTGALKTPTEAAAIRNWREAKATP